MWKKPVYIKTVCSGRTPRGPRPVAAVAAARLGEDVPVRHVQKERKGSAPTFGRRNRPGRTVFGFSTAKVGFMDCLIGYTGFVGGNLAEQGNFDVLINSKNFHTIENCRFDRVVCAGVSAVKWKANKDPENDLARIEELAEVLKTVHAGKFVLISTIDVYPVNSDVDEDFDCRTRENHPYGRHRLQFEEFCSSHFPDVLTVRLPGLFGKGLKKNVIFDLLNDNCLDMINRESSFQYYDLRNLSCDIALAEKAGLHLVNFFTEPIRTGAIIDRFFPGKRVGANASPPVSYDMHTKYACLRGLSGNYLYGAGEIMALLEEFIAGYRHA